MFLHFRGMMEGALKRKTRSGSDNAGLGSAVKRMKAVIFMFFFVLTRRRFSNHLPILGQPITATIRAGASARSSRSTPEILARSLSLGFSKPPGRPSNLLR